MDNLLRTSGKKKRRKEKKTRRNQFAKYDCFWNVCLATDQQMLQLWPYFIFLQQYHIAFQHKPALTLKSTLVTSAALLWWLGTSQLPLHTLPKPWLIAALASRGEAETASVSAFLRRNNLFPPIALTWHEGRKQLDVPISFSLLLVPCLCCPPLLTQLCLTTFPIRHPDSPSCWWRSQSKVKFLCPFLLDTENKSKPG